MSNLTVTESVEKIIITQAGTSSVYVTQSGGESLIITPDCGSVITITENVQVLQMTETALETLVIHDGPGDKLVIEQTIGEGCGGCPDYAGASTDATDGQFYYYSWSHKSNENDFAAQRYDSATRTVSPTLFITTQPDDLAAFEALDWP